MKVDNSEREKKKRFKYVHVDIYNYVSFFRTLLYYNVVLKALWITDSFYTTKTTSECYTALIRFFVLFINFLKHGFLFIYVNIVC